MKKLLLVCLLSNINLSCKILKTEKAEIATETKKIQLLRKKTTRCTNMNTLKKSNYSKCQVF